MADNSDEWGCLIVFVGGMIWLAWPSEDQVCRQRAVPVWDSITGADGQLTCQEMLSRLDHRNVDQQRQITETRDRVEEIEGKLNL